MKTEETKDLLKNKKMLEVVVAGIVIFVVIVGLTVGLNRIFNRPARIASVDMEKVMNSHPAFREAMTDFQKEIGAMQEQLGKLKGDEKTKEQQKMQQQIQQIAIRLQQEAMAKVTSDVEKIAKAKGYTYVVEKSMLVVGGRDITDDVLSFLKGEETKAESEKTDTSTMPMIPVK